jgi:hypothetical protein
LKYPTTLEECKLPKVKIPLHEKILPTLIKLLKERLDAVAIASSTEVDA